MSNVQFTYRGGPLEKLSAHVQLVSENEIGKPPRLIRFGTARGLYQFVREEGVVFARHVPSEQDVAAPEKIVDAEAAPAVPVERPKSVWRQAEELRAQREAAAAIAAAALKAAKEAEEAAALAVKKAEDDAAAAQAEAVAGDAVIADAIPDTIAP